MDPSRESFKERSWTRFLILPSLQLRMALLFSASAGTLSAGVLTLFYRYVKENYDVLVELSPMEPEVKRVLYEELDQLVYRLGLGTFGFTLLMALIGILISHRLAGPLYQFKKTFKEVSDGKRSARVHLRASDELQDLARAFNAMMDRTERRESDRKEPPFT